MEKIPNYLIIYKHGPHQVITQPICSTDHCFVTSKDQMDSIFKTLYINPFYDKSMH